jgi:DNA methylase
MREMLPQTLDEVDRALIAVTTPEEAEALFRQVASIDDAAARLRADKRQQAEWSARRLRAERRWGELLGDGYTPRESKRRLDSDYVARSMARKLKDVPEPVFSEFIATRVRREEAEMLTRAKLLRAGREKAPSPEVDSEYVYDDITIRHGDLRTTLDDLAGHVDAIITDPPYPAEHLDEWDALGGLATRLLNPYGVLVAMSGQAWLPDVLQRLAPHLTYRWCGAYLTDGPATRIHARKVGTKWKPILIYGGTDFLTQDLFTSEAEDKDHHDWGQSESGFAELVERFTRPGQLVVDPFLGGGTTAVVCRDLGRRFVGCDIAAAAVANTRERLVA